MNVDLLTPISNIYGFYAWRWLDRLVFSLFGELPLAVVPIGGSPHWGKVGPFDQRCHYRLLIDRLQHRVNRHSSLDLRFALTEDRLPR